MKACWFVRGTTLDFPTALFNSVSDSQFNSYQVFMESRKANPTLREYLIQLKNRKRSTSRSLSKKSEDSKNKFDPQTFEEQIEDFQEYVSPFIQDRQSKAIAQEKLDKMYDTYVKDTSSHASHPSHTSELYFSAIQPEEPKIIKGQVQQKKAVVHKKPKVLTEEEQEDKLLAAGSYYLKLKALRSKSNKRIRRSESLGRQNVIQKQEEDEVHEAQYGHCSNIIPLESKLQNKN